MRIRSELNLLVVVLTAAVALWGFGSIALFGRMSPAIERILAENVVSMTACEEMLEALADPSLAPAEAERRFARALKTASANLTEPEERPLVAQLEAAAPDLFGGGPADRAAVVEAIRDLAEVNRNSMLEADEEARRLGLAGAWAVAGAGLFILGLTIVVARRIDARLVRPLSHLASVAEGYDAGNVHRRAAEVGPREIREVAHLLNELLEARRQIVEDKRLAAADRAFVLHVLDERDGPWVTVDEGGQVLSANRAALDRMQEDGEPDPERLAARRAEGEEIRGEQWLVRLDG